MDWISTWLAAFSAWYMMPITMPKETHTIAITSIRCTCISFWSRINVWVSDVRLRMCWNVLRCQTAYMRAKCIDSGRSKWRKRDSKEKIRNDRKKWTANFYIFLNLDKAPIPLHQFIRCCGCCCEWRRRTKRVCYG